MLFKGLIKYVSNFHFRILIKVFIENCAASSAFKNFLRDGVELETNLAPQMEKGALIMKMHKKKKKKETKV